jgi:hypothetical protein
MTQEEKTTHRKNKLFTYATTASVALSAGVGLGSGVLTDINPDRLLGLNTHPLVDSPLRPHTANPNSFSGDASCKTTSIALAKNGVDKRLDLDGNGGYDFKFDNDEWAAWLTASAGNYVLANSNTATNSARALNSGDPISFNNARFLPGIHYLNYSTAAQGEFQNGQTKYAGVKFKIGVDYHVGWLKISITGANDSVTVQQWCYNDTAGQGIYAGQTPTAVEMVKLETSSSSTTLPAVGAALAVGIAGAWAWLRRKTASA